MNRTPVKKLILLGAISLTDYIQTNIVKTPRRTLVLPAADGDGGQQRRCVQARAVMHGAEGDRFVYSRPKLRPGCAADDERRAVSRASSRDSRDQRGTSR